ncbi:MAG: nicotinate phosphoribosyltransferase [Gemmatimonadetes bacterium]|uniref:nicotinate phosphoribosyltransferase n=1 Tax=Candidatus Kutchimonas denitrificans TaxID=3056748 RepID=A0AAE5CCY1_9BACT|nr:nicotinate phosphoribosyltransferase [Gemmatimonadota bacterium]NIR74804.1 nicotinate phosphoribosyltransferase [Candidatus Kutchimonas denitrificans]NIR99915.1 nicotinate phosphoribosyltransferase [Gemmatimonadota bacterium]NIT65499.1 nicotinate phosphoribosyltransferase [Gemmatimonadota bacterium]NIU52469.1 nicotinate phosphoribosyltransferase [Gemmatimonadota bacterium]
MGFHIATPDQIKAGAVTDVYFQRTAEILDARGVDGYVRAEFTAKSLPDDWDWAVFAGLAEVEHLLEGTDVNVRAMEEGAVFRPYEPVLEIQGSYREFGVYETSALGLICQASGIATRAARCRLAAGPDRGVISFGARRMHPAIAPMIERAAYLGGCDGVAAVASAELLGIEPTGTMPHALVLVMGDTVKATLAFDEVIDPGVPRVSLIDTFSDEKFAALEVAEALREKLSAVRLDTPSSRRGSLFDILAEVRWELDLHGFEAVDLFVSGGIDEEAIRELNPLVDGYGVGTWISAAPVVDFSMDIVELDGKPLAKRGKWSGAKQVLRCAACADDEIVALHKSEEWPDSCPECGSDMEPLLAPWMSGGQRVGAALEPAELRRRTLERLTALQSEPEEEPE